MKNMLKNFGIGIVILALFFLLVALPGKGVQAGPEFETGVVTATGATINVAVGFVPRYVTVTRQTSTYLSAVTVRWDYNMGSGVCSMSSGTNLTYETSNCIKAYAGSTTKGVGFSILTNSTLNSGTTDTLYWQAWQ